MLAASPVSCKAVTLDPVDRGSSRGDCGVLGDTGVARRASVRPGARVGLQYQYGVPPRVGAGYLAGIQNSLAGLTTHRSPITYKRSSNGQTEANKHASRRTHTRRLDERQWPLAHIPRCGPGRREQSRSIAILRPRPSQPQVVQGLSPPRPRTLRPERARRVAPGAAPLPMAAGVGVGGLLLAAECHSAHAAQEGLEPPLRLHATASTLAMPQR